MFVAELHHDWADQQPNDINNQKPYFCLKVYVHLQSIMLASPEYRKMAKNPSITMTYVILRVLNLTSVLVVDFWTIR